MKKFWFKPKTFGYGATPTTWEGWALAAGYMMFVLTATLFLIGRQPTAPGWIAWAVIVIPVTIAMMRFTRQKTEGEWRWRWGRTNSRNTS